MVDLDKRREGLRMAKRTGSHRQYGRQQCEGQMRGAATIARGMAASHRHLDSTRTPV